MPTRSLGFLLTSPSGGFSSPVMILMIVLKPGKKREGRRGERIRVERVIGMKDMRTEGRKEGREGVSDRGRRKRWRTRE